MHEMAAVSSLPEHPNIVAYYRAWQQAAHFYIQMALCEGGSLADLLETVGTYLWSFTFIDPCISSHHSRSLCFVDP